MIVLADGSEIPTRAVIVASGARYQRLAVDDLGALRGRRRLLRGDRPRGPCMRRHPVVVVGGGNSAGQAAIYLGAEQLRVSRSPSAAMTSPTACRTT